MQNKINSSKKNTPDNNEKIPYMKRAIEHWKIVALYLILYDVIAVNVSYFLGLWLRFDLHYGTDLYRRLPSGLWKAPSL